MQTRIYTPQQSAAIAERKKTLLISAAAGSGKTATLTQRIISSLTDREAPADISRMLIVTFTRAAASEMRERIEAALRDALAKDPQSKHLSRQLLLLGGARISTIDAFCSDVVRRGAASLGISPSFRVADESERLLLANEVLNRLIEDAYDGRLPFVSPDEFALLADSVTGVRSEAQLSEILFSLAEKLSGFPEGIGYLKVCAERLAAEAEKPLDERSFSLLAVKNASEMLSHYKKIYDDLLLDGKSLNGKTLLLLPFIEREHELIVRCLSSLDKGYSAICDTFRTEALLVEKLPVVRSFDTDFDEQFCKFYRRVRKDFFEKYQENRTLYFTFSAENIENDYKSSVEFERRLADLLMEYDERFQREKHSRGICDFGDIEHYAYRLLVKDGERTPLAESISRAYDYIYIDEFQDTNSLQDAIFRAVSRKDNLFMVGDVKQSIYGFRNAEPSIFAAYKRSFPAVEDAAESPTASIFMSQNFRSDTPIIDFTNRIFDSLFELAGDSIAYAKEDRLSAGKKQPTAPMPVEVWLCDRLSESASEEEDEEEEESEDLDEEVTAVAKEIRRLLSEETLDDGTPIKPSDIAVLLRGGRADAEKFAEAIRLYGIPVSSEEDKDFFLKPAILLVLSLLNVIDNPYRDIPLAALLRSPLYCFTMDELVTLRLGQSENASLYEALSEFAEKESGDVGEKARAFLSELSSFRRMAEGIPVDRLLRHLYRETGLLGLSSEGDGGAQWRQHLLILYQYARRFEASSFRGLYQFISYINTVIAENRRVSELESKGEELEAVRIMTVHHSKGLEFPVTFLSRTAKRYNESDLFSPILFHRDLGAVTRFRDETGLARVGNLLYNATSYALERAGHEEEMRVLYVALTRARERLYLTARTQKKTPAEELISEASLLRPYLSRFKAYSYKSYLSLVLATVTGDEPYVRLRAIGPAADTEGMLKTESGEASADREASVDADTLRGRFGYEYPYKAVSEMPQKLSVSRLYPTVLDEEGEEDAVALQRETVSKMREGTVRLPLFMTGGGEESAARRGTATHLFMQFCDYERLKTEKVEKELSRLVLEKFITEEDARLVFLSELEAFRSSDFFAELLTAKKLYRELRFHASLPAARFTADKEKKMALLDERIFVQGVIDCILVRENGQYSVVDYKTDRLSPAELGDKALAQKKLAERHALQLSYYAAAATEIFGYPPTSLLIYSLPLGDTVEIDPEKAIEM